MDLAEIHVGDAQRTGLVRHAVGQRMNVGQFMHDQADPVRQIQPYGYALRVALPQSMFHGTGWRTEHRNMAATTRGKCHGDRLTGYVIPCFAQPRIGCFIRLDHLLLDESARLSGRRRSPRRLGRRVAVAIGAGGDDPHRVFNAVGQPRDHVLVPAVGFARRRRHNACRRVGHRLPRRVVLLGSGLPLHLEAGDRRVVGRRPPHFQFLAPGAVGRQRRGRRRRISRGSDRREQQKHRRYRAHDRPGDDRMRGCFGRSGLWHPHVSIASIADGRQTERARREDRRP